MFSTEEHQTHFQDRASTQRKQLNDTNTEGSLYPPPLPLNDGAYNMPIMEPTRIEIVESIA